MRWVYLGCVILLTAVANVLLKHAAARVPEALSGPDYMMHAVRSPFILGGIFCLGVAVTGYALSLRFFDLSVAYPIMTCSVVVLVAFLSLWLFGEEFSTAKIAGTLLVVTGVVVLSSHGD